MPERSSRWRAQAAAGLLLALVAGLAIPTTAGAIELPGESCPAVAPGSSTSAGCGEGRSGSGGSGRGGGGLPNLGGLLPILGVALGGTAIALAATFLVLRRRAGAPVAPADPSEWWICRNCGKTNVIGSPRCYACGAWQG